MGFNFETISQVSSVLPGGVVDLANFLDVGTRQRRASSGMVTW